MTDASRRTSNSRVVSALVTAYRWVRAATVGRWGDDQPSDSAPRDAGSQSATSGGRDAGSAAAASGDGDAGSHATAVDGGQQRARARQRDGGTPPVDGQDLVPVSPEDRVRAVVEQADDWTPQSDIVDMVDVSSSSVSRYLSSLEDRGEVRRVRIGREKVVGPADAALDVDPDDSPRTDRRESDGTTANGSDGTIARASERTSAAATED